jgi:hypothetical protein
MAHKRWFRASGLALIALLFSLTAVAQSGLAKKSKGGGDIAGQASDAPEISIQNALLSKFQLTRTTADRTDIVMAGDVVTIQKPGLVMFAGTAVPSTNNYKNGSIGQGFGTALIMANPNTLQRTFVPEEKCWITGIQVQKDGVLFQLFSDPYNSFRYYGNLKILFPNKKDVPPVDVVLGLIAEVLTGGQSDDQGGQPEQAPAQVGRSRVRDSMVPASAPAPEPVAAPADPEPAQDAISDIAPPPPPADAPPPTIELGQTKDQVIAGLGQPAKIAKLGVKEIYYYKDMKVTFTNGKVSNVE